jgi:hypothetical protein
MLVAAAGLQKILRGEAVSPINTGRTIILRKAIRVAKTFIKFLCPIKQTMDRA